MIADLNTMPRMFWECNRRYFDHQLQVPRFDVTHSYRVLGRFEYRIGERHLPLKKRHIVILMSDCFDFDEDTFRNIMVHEMIHYYLYVHDTGATFFRRILRSLPFCHPSHGTAFKAMAQRLNEQYGLHVTVTGHVSSIRN